MSQQEGPDDGGPESDGPDDRASRQSANLARHLNGQHADTVLLRARHAEGGSPRATAADLTGADDDGLAVTASTPEGPVVLRLAPD